MDDNSFQTIGEDIRRKHSLLLETCQKMTHENESLKSQLKLFKMLHNVQTAYSNLQNEVEGYKQQQEEQSRLLQQSEMNLKVTLSKNTELMDMVQTLQSRLMQLEHQVVINQNTAAQRSSQEMSRLQEEAKNLERNNHLLSKQIETAELETLQTRALLNSFSRIVNEYREAVISYLHNQGTAFNLNWNWDDKEYMQVLEQTRNDDSQRHVAELFQQSHGLLSSFSKVVQQTASLRAKYEQRSTQDTACQANTVEDQMNTLRFKIDSLKASKTTAESDLRQIKSMYEEIRSECDRLSTQNKIKSDRIVHLEGEVGKLIEEKKGAERLKIQMQHGTNHPFFEEYIELKREVAVLRRHQTDSIPKPTPPNSTSTRTRSSADISENVDEINSNMRLKVGWGDNSSRPVSQGSDKSRLRTPPATAPNKGYSISRLSVQPITQGLPSLPPSRR